MNEGVRDQCTHTVTAFGVDSAQEQKVETTAEAWLRRTANPVADCVVVIVDFMFAVSDGDMVDDLVFVLVCGVVRLLLVALLIRFKLGATTVFRAVTVIVVAATVNIVVLGAGVTVMAVPGAVTVDVSVVTGYLLEQ